MKAGPLLGAHVSIAGGFVRAVERARMLGCRTMQVFVKGTVNWSARSIAADEARAFRDAAATAGIARVVAHGAYLTNLAEAAAAPRQRAIDGFLVELERAELLGVESVVLHPGSHCGAGAPAGSGRIRDALDEVVRRSAGLEVRILLENAAGMGSALGGTVDELACLLEGIEPRHRLGICIDTCHALAAGHDIGNARGYQSFWTELDRRIGIDRVGAIHLNDSKHPLGSRRDRHEHIGQGHVGREAFRLLLADRRLSEVPKLLETPKAGDMDRRNLALLRRLARAPAPRCQDDA